MSTWTLAFLLEVPITASNKWIDVDIGGGEVSTSIAVDDYDDMVAVAAALETALQVIDATFSVDIGEDGKVTIARTGSFSILWKNGTHGRLGTDTHIGTVLGFDDTDDDLSAASYESDNQHTLGFYVTSGNNPKLDSYDRKVSRGPETFIAMDDTSWRLTYGRGNIRVVELQAIPYNKFFPDESPTNEAFMDWWIEAAEGTPFKYYGDSGDFSTSDLGQYILECRADEDLLEGVPRRAAGEAYYSKTLRMIKQA